jgi:hypothetical protein
MKPTTQASKEMRKVLEHAELAANYLFEHEILGRLASEEEVSDLECLRDMLSYALLPKIDTYIEEQRRKIKTGT